MDYMILKSLLALVLLSVTLCHLFGENDASSLDSSVFRQRKPGCRLYK